MLQFGFKQIGFLKILFFQKSNMRLFFLQAAMKSH